MRAIQLYAIGIADAVLEGKSSIPEVPAGEDEFVELDEEGNPKKKSARRRPAPARKKAAIRRKPAAQDRRHRSAPEQAAAADVAEAVGCGGRRRRCGQSTWMPPMCAARLSVSRRHGRADQAPRRARAGLKPAPALRRRPASPATNSQPGMRQTLDSDDRQIRGSTTMTITADAVKQLRERTGAGMMECKKALVERRRLDAAAELMRKQGLAKADKKAARVAAEGTIVDRAGRRRPVRSDRRSELRNRFRGARATSFRAFAARPRRNSRCAQRSADLSALTRCADRAAARRSMSGAARWSRRSARTSPCGASRAGARTDGARHLSARHAHRCAGGPEGRR